MVRTRECFADGDTVYEVLDSLSKVAILVFVVTCMVAAGLGLTLRDIVAPFRRARLVLMALVANFVIAPMIAFMLTRVVHLDRPYEIGLLLLGGAAGAPFLPKLAEFARGDLAYSVGLMLLLMIGSVIFMPVALPLMIPGLSAEPWPILKPLLLTMLIPLAGGVAFRNQAAVWALRLRPAISKVANASMFVAVVLLLGLNFKDMLGTFGSGSALLAVAFVFSSILVGYLLGGPDPGTRSVLALGTGQRNVAAALVIATQNFSEPGVVIMLLIATFAGLFVLLLAGRWMSRRAMAAHRITNTPQANDSINPNQLSPVLLVNASEPNRNEDLS